ncbi:glyoxalase [Deinococcus aetherius]|uniref:Glyoxalase n=1 Tax=Deinococcus aetherius TaxID=200252 RepID=A0ABM8ADT3_9DEIO|nr:VOC family protein [Deinococcus aetherius]BDP41937.1 glyoxalase [Deinococcus aetherius]
MKLNHLNLTVTDVRATRTFLETYFGLRGQRKNNDHMAFLSDGNGTLISLFRGEDVHYPETFHVGFMQANPEAVNEINRRLREGGYEVEPPSRQHGSWTFYFRSPGGFVIEVLC